MALDLLTWPEIREAEAALASAHVEQAEAQRRYRLSPHGQKSARLIALQAAVQRSLEAELQLARVRRSEA
ncbi:hypothetical protein JIP62_06295 [Brevundimonas vitis]|uniref:Uncharacterized protein n=1 Tax=Brevundimonas vitisensis TaxID=2800818 RepID=A0ABX7BUB4_9CAUL|nr:hypothetical protein [Brevundimonas vitisensis]QQQ19694.1 hypothetical protein JIP62_06295 [Brevundimonas vitisensis]